MSCRSSLNAMALVGQITTPPPTVFHEGSGMYGGKIWAENRQVGGAAFRFVEERVFHRFAFLHSALQDLNLRRVMLLGEIYPERWSGRLRGADRGARGDEYRDLNRSPPAFHRNSPSSLGSYWGACSSTRHS